MNSEFSQSFQFELSDETIENLKKIIKPSEPVKELTIGIDYGNGKSIQATGNFKNINFKYKKRKRGKNYKLFKEANLLYLIMQFKSKYLEVCNENNGKVYSGLLEK